MKWKLRFSQVLYRMRTSSPRRDTQNQEKILVINSNTLFSRVLTCFYERSYTLARRFGMLFDVDG